MKQTILRVLLFVSITVFLSFQSFSQTFPTATQVASSMTVGWNIGNSLEAVWSTGDAWSETNVNQRLIDSVKAAGFNTIRIPIAWDNHSTNSVIDAAWLTRVKQVVDYCIGRQMYVIINIHWDNGWLENNCTTSAQTSVNAKQKTYWTQIANYFKSYDEHLLFASANEPDVSDATGMTVLLSYHQTFINAVRATGGNNSQRILIVQGPGTDTEKTFSLMNTMPTDNVTGRLMAEVHYYTPYQYCLMSTDASWGNMFYYWGSCFHSTTDASHNPTWGEESFLDTQFKNLKSQFVDKGIPVIVGEFGVNKRLSLTGVNATLHLASREYYFRYITTAARKNGLILVYWDPGFQGDNSTTLFDRLTGAQTDRSGINALMYGVYGTHTTISCNTNDCKGVKNGNAYTNKSGQCVVGYSASSNPPTITTPVTYCQNTTATALTATGTALKWYTVATGGTSSGTAPIPLTNTVGSTTFYVSQTVNSIESPRAAIVVTINVAPSTPTVTTSVTYCQNATTSALTATGTALKWYSVAIGGTALASAPTPSTTATGTLNYYVSQTIGSCESPRATLVVTINSTPVIPSVTTSLSYCQNETATTLSANGTALKWYTVATGGNALSSAPIPSTTATGTINYYVSQTTGTCESARSTIAVTVNPLPTITAYMQVNGGAWVAAKDSTVLAGQTVNLGPQPNVTTGWSWTGPNAYSSISRQISLASITNANEGIYSATYTNANGCKATMNHKITVLSKQTISLNQGWNLISINLRPNDSTIATLFNGLDVLEIKTMEAFWRLGQNSVLNSLNTIISGNGYFVNMNIAGSLTFFGKPLTQSLNTLTLKTGWQIIGCPYQTATAISSIFNDTNSLKIKNFDGFWIPNGTANSLTQIVPGKGYFLKK